MSVGGHGVANYANTTTGLAANVEASTYIGGGIGQSLGGQGVVELIGLHSGSALLLEMGGLFLLEDGISVLLLES